MKLSSGQACLILSTIVQSIVFLTIGVIWSNKRHANNAFIETKICSDCKDLLARRDYGSGTLGQIASLKTNGNNTCCGEATTILNLTARKKVKDFFFEQTLGRPQVEAVCDPIDPPDIPLGLVEGVVGYMKVSKDFHRLLWNNHSISRTHGDMIHLENEGELYVHTAGKYYVSARLNYMFNSSMVVMGDTVTLQMSVLSHKLGDSRVVHEIRKRLGQSQDSPHHRISITIVKRQIFPEWKSLGNETILIEPVQFGALFDLFDYDRISLAISDPRLIALNNANDQFMATFYHT